MEHIYILCGPQGVGKTQKAEQLVLLGCQHIVDDWNGTDALRPGSLAITNAEYTMPEGGVAFHVEDAAGLDALIATLSA